MTRRRRNRWSGRTLLPKRFRQPDVETEVFEEIEHHLAEVADRLIEHGMELEKARREAERRFGNVTAHGRALVDLNGRGRMMRKWIEGLDRGRAGICGTGTAAESGFLPGRADHSGARYRSERGDVRGHGPTPASGSRAHRATGRGEARSRPAAEPRYR